MLEEELRAAAAQGNLEVVVSLLEKGAKLSQDSSGRTPIHLAAATGNPELVKSLVTPKTVNIGDSVGRTAIQIAATGGHVKVVQELLNQGADPNIRDKLHGNSPLHEASWHGFSQTIALLLKSKANPDVKNCAGFYPLHLACQAGHNQSCRELLLAGANPDVQNNYGDTSLHTSARYGHAGVARILISASCRVSDQNKNGDTALHIAAAMGRRKLTTILLEAGCDKTIRNKQYEAACDIATRKDLNEIISILQNIKPQKAKKKSKKTSETSDSDKKSREVQVHPPHDPAACGSAVRWSPYGCHYYPDPNSFPQPRLDSLPGEPLGKGEQYYLDLAGNIRKGPVGVGLTCYCANFLRDMEARLEKNNVELKHKIRATRHELQERVERTEELLNEWVRHSRRKHRRRRSHSVDLLQDTPRHGEDESRSSRKSTPALPSPPCSEDVAQIEAGLKSLKMPQTECANNQTVVQEESYPAEIETMPYRSRTAVYSPTCFHLSDPEKSTGKSSRVVNSLEQLNFDRSAV